MFLSDLEIIGFKSFGLKTKFKFSEGITCLVGPNGCGKSNIVDAIRWVLGEQKTAVLRSDSMDNIIFNGTKHRKPAGISEVVLTIENNKHILPSEFDSISVARRLNRNGDSKYLLNKTNCRLKDINNLFMDTGMGPDSYSVIELKMVENLLSGRSEDRKNLLEEAAGITKYKVRIKESERKLKGVEEDLERIEDIVIEVRKNVNSLSRQAAKTRRFNKLSEELKEKEVQLYAIEISSFTERKKELDKIFSMLKEKDEKAQLELGELDEAIKSKIYKKQEKDNQNKDLRIKISSLQAKLSDSKQTVAVSEVKEKNLKRDIARFEEDKAAINDSNKKRESRLSQIKDDIKEIDSELNSVLVKLNEKNDKQQQIQENINEIRYKIDNEKIRQNSIESDISKIKYRESKQKEALEKNQKELELIKSRIEIENKNINEIHNEIEVLSKLENKLSQEKLNSENSLNDLEEKIKNSKNELSELRDKFLKLNNEKIATEREIDFWESSFDKSSNSGFLLSDTSWNNGFSTLVENLDIEEKYQKAFSTLFTNQFNSIIVRNIEDANLAKKILEDNKKGKQSFLVADKINEFIPDIIKHDLVLSQLWEVPNSNAEISKYLSYEFNRFVLVENSSDALTVISESDAICAVTLQGSLFYKSGRILIGSDEKARTDFGKIEKIERLNTKLNSINQDIESSKSQFEALEKKIESFNTSKIKNKLDDIIAELNTNSNKLSDLKINQNSKQNLVEVLNQNLDKLNSEIKSLSEIESDYNSIHEKQKEIENIKINIQKLNVELEKNIILLDDSTKIITKLNIEKVNFENKINNLKNEFKNIESSIRSSKIRLEKLEKEFDNNTSDLEDLIESANNAASNIEEFSEQVNLLKTESEVLQSLSKEIQIDIDQLQTQKQEKFKDYETVTKQSHKTEIELTEVNTKIEAIINNASEKYELSIKDLNKITCDFEEFELKTDVNEIKRKLAEIGNVNFMALDDYENESQRLSFYETQIDDLVNSKTTLIQTIKEINQTAEEILVSTFEQVRANFQDLFKTLFNEEGECDISLEGDNPLDADLKIMAKPPGKKPHSIDMLSGGEKTLTAIALLFAIYLVKPSPFCILDEVDAPLDDNNIGRFVRLIKKFSNNTQFLVVTHNKKTMEAADNLYGITQQEEGLSKIVSVQLNRNN